MKLTIEIDLDNSAFEYDGPDELRRMLVRLCDRLPEPLSDTGGAVNLYDSNGNHVGTARIADDVKP